MKKIRLNPTLKLTATIEFRHKNKLETIELDLEKAPEMNSVVQFILESLKEGELPSDFDLSEVYDDLCEIGVLAEESEEANPCLAYHLATTDIEVSPADLDYDSERADADLIVSHERELPALDSATAFGGVQEYLTHDSSDVHLVNIRSSCSGLQLPHAISTPMLDAWTNLHAGRVTVERLPPDIVDSLRAAGLLTAAGSPDRDGYVREAAHLLSDQQYATLHNLFTPSFTRAMSEYSRALRRLGHLDHGDDQVANRWISHNDPLFVALHQELGKLIGDITQLSGAPCKPSYSYFADYDRGARLPRHTDRPQCRWNLSVVLDSDPVLPRESQWPIFLEIGGQPTAVQLGLGDGLLYSGTQLSHWRDPLSVADRVSVCFFHFVDIDFDGSLN